MVWLDSPGLEAYTFLSRASKVFSFFFFLFYQQHPTHGSKSFQGITAHPCWNLLSLAHVYVNHTVVIVICNLNQLKSSTVLHAAVAWCLLVHKTAYYSG